jgi:hypothetical protein
MSVQFASTTRAVAGRRSTGYYLMELRRHLAETQSRRNKLAPPACSLAGMRGSTLSNRSRRFANV